MERRLAVGALMDAVEMLASARDYRRDGILSWNANGAVDRRGRQRPANMLHKLMEYPQFLAVPVTRAAASIALLSPGRTRTQRAVLTGVLLATARLTHLHHRFGYDGSDQISDVALIAVGLEKVFSKDDRARQACLRFLAYQTCVGYFSSGMVKAVSPMWRSGEAVTGVLRTESYGDKSLHNVLRKHPILPRIMAWTVILGELGYPLVLVSPRPVALAIRAAMASFHLANARWMGLNRFVWGFVGTYPAVTHVSRPLRQVGR